MPYVGVSLGFIVGPLVVPPSAAGTGALAAMNWCYGVAAMPLLILLSIDHQVDCRVQRRGERLLHFVRGTGARAGECRPPPPRFGR